MVAVLAFPVFWPMSMAGKISTMYSSLSLRSTRIARQECADLVADCLFYIRLDGACVPVEQRAWKIGMTFSWHYVKIVEFRVNQLIDALEKIAMAKAKRNGKQSSDFASYEFVKCELNSEDKKAAKIWIEENTTELGSKLHDVVASDYKYSLSFSSEHDTFTACLVGKEDNPINSKKTLTARHKDWLVATMTVLYKHEVIFKSGVWESGSGDEDDGWA